MPGTHTTSEVCLTDITNQQGVLDEEDKGLLLAWNNFCAVDTNYAKRLRTWRPIEVSTDWLNVLTPPLNASEPLHTTLASVIESSMTPYYDIMLLTGLLSTQTVAIRQIQSIVSSFIADGLSRIGWDENYAYNLTRSHIYHCNRSSYCTNTYGVPVSSDTQGWYYSAKNAADRFHSLIKGSASLTPLPSYRHEEGSVYHLKVTVTGYGLGVKDIPCCLAITVLFVHLVLVILHVMYVIWEKDDSRAWSSPMDMLLLSQSSAPSGVGLANTYAGAKAHRTKKLHVRIRERADVKVGQEQLHLVLNSDEGYKVEERRAYGVTC